MEVTLDTLREKLIFRADLPAVEPRRYSNDQLDMLLYESIRRLHGNLTTWWGEDYNLTFAQQTINAGAPYFTLTSYPQIKSVLWSHKGDFTDSVKLRRVSAADFQKHSEESRRWSRADPPVWFFVRDPTLNRIYLTLNPTPTQDEEVRLLVDMEPQEPLIERSIYLYWGWEDWIILDSMIRIRQRDKQDAADLIAERAELDRRIQQQASERDQTEIHTVRNVFPDRGDSRDEDWWRDLP